MNPSDLPVADTRSHASESSAAHTWQYAVIASLVVLAAALASHWDTAMTLVHTWEHSSAYQHSFIVFPISAWLIWRRRRQLAAITPRPYAPVLFALGALSMLWLLGHLANIQTFQQFSLVVTIPLLLWAVLGTSFASTVAFALAFMVFAWPFGEFLIPPLIDWTADFTVAALRVTGVPVFRQGNSFAIPTGSWSVVEACSGVRYLIAALCAGSLFAYLTYRSWTRRWIFFAACALVSILANWLRAYLIVLIGHLTNNKLAAGFDHVVYGWIFFGFVMTFVFYVGSRWRERAAPEGLPPAQDPARSNPPGAARFGGVALAAIALVAVGPGLALALQQSTAAKSSNVSLSVPPADGAWQPTEGQLTTWESPFQNRSAGLRQSYRDGDARVELAIAFYRNQHADAKLLTLASTTLSDYEAPWAVVERRVVEIDDGRRLKVIEKRLQLARSTTQNLMVWEWYWVDGVETTSVWRAKLAEIRAKISGAGDDAGAVVLLAPYHENPSAAHQALLAFVRQMHPAISKTLADAAAQ